MAMRLRSGIDYQLEEQATDLLVKERKDSGTKKLSDKQDWLTEAQMKTRLDHEVYTLAGHPEPHIREGIFKRVYNPQTGKRPVGLKSHDEV